MKSSVCVDASLLVRLLVPGPYSDVAEDMVGDWLRGDTPIIAPFLATYEVTSTLRRLVHLKVITAENGDAAFRQFLLLDISYSTRRDLFPLAWQLAKRFDRPRAYDTAYVALAQVRRCDLWTADERLYNAVRDELAFVRWIGDQTD